MTVAGLVLTDGNEQIQPAANASRFSFPTKLQSGSHYAVSVAQQPPGASVACTVAAAGSSGTVGSADVSVAVTCAPIAPQTYAVGGSLSGLTADGLVLSDGTEQIHPGANATSFTFPTRLKSGSAYDVSVVQQPPGFTVACQVGSTGASGTVGSADVSATVKCDPAVASVSTLVASDAWGHSDDSYVFGVAVDNAGNVYAADYNHNEIRKITPTGVITTLAGGGASGHADGSGANASFFGPTALAVDAAGNVYVADQNNHEIRKITRAGVVTTLAGNPSPGNADGSGANASFYYPDGLAVDAAGNVYVADANNFAIRKITPAGVVTTLAGGRSGQVDGSGSDAKFSSPAGVAVDSAGNVYVGDGTAIRKVTATGVVTTLAGSTTAGNADGSGASAGFDSAWGLTVDAAGNVYVADSYNNEIREITPAGVVTTLAGSTASGHADGLAGLASFNVPVGVAQDAAGNLYVVDLYNHSIRKIVSEVH